jgi:hypothetical protein
MPIFQLRDPLTRDPEHVADLFKREAILVCLLDRFGQSSSRVGRLGFSITHPLVGHDDAVEQSGNHNRSVTETCRVKGKNSLDSNCATR